jgi:hypothetical protein
MPTDRQTDRQTDRHDEATRRCAQFLANAPKNTTILRLRIDRSTDGSILSRLNAARSGRISYLLRVKNIFSLSV